MRQKYNCTVVCNKNKDLQCCVTKIKIYSGVQQKQAFTVVCNTKINIYRNIYSGVQQKALPGALAAIRCCRVTQVQRQEKMTGGTPEVRSDKSLALMTFNI